MTEPTHDEFTCTVCGRLICSFPPRDPPPKVCGSCEWLQEYIVDPKDRAKLRAWMERDAEPPP
jgi:hypothetical protein